MLGNVKITDKMKNLTEEQKTKIALEMLDKEPMETIGEIALLKLSQLAVSVNSEETVLSTKATFNGKRYECKMLITCTEV
jgi:hypothetical protein